MRLSMPVLTISLVVVFLAGIMTVIGVQTGQKVQGNLIDRWSAWDQYDEISYLIPEIPDFTGIKVNDISDTSILFGDPFNAVVDLEVNGQPTVGWCHSEPLGEIRCGFDFTIINETTGEVKIIRVNPINGGFMLSQRARFVKWYSKELYGQKITYIRYTPDEDESI